MAEADWTVLTDALAIGSCDRGVTAGIARPPSSNPAANTHLYGFNSLDTTQGVSGLFVNLVNFAPMAKGGSISACIKRGPGGGPTNFAPFLFIGLQGPAVADQGYILGLGDGDPSHIVLRKGALTGGLPDVAPAAALPLNQGVLRRSTATFAQDTWLHLRLDMNVQPNGDVFLHARQNDLNANPIGAAPVWTAIPGMDMFTDDALAVNTGSAAFTSGRVGFGFFTKDVTRRGFFDQVEVFRQL